MPQPGPVEQSASPERRPGPVFAQNDDSQSAKGAAAAPRILIVEDDFLIATQAEDTLIDAGFDLVGIAASAEEAIELAAAQRPALAIMDIRLAGARDGIDAALELFQRYQIRCIFATAYSGQESRSRAAPAAPLGWLPKPYTTVSLVESVRKALKDLGGTSH
jgi:DNA-binding NarL/FixJ family response regulator